MLFKLTISKGKDIFIHYFSIRDLLNMCHKASKEVLKQDIEFKTLQDSKLAENHIVICGMVENIIHFVMPLRADHLIDPSPIVILHDEELTGK